MEADSWRLQQLVTAEAAAAALRTGTKCTNDDLLSDIDVGRVTDERFRMADVEKYFEDEAWDQVMTQLNIQMLADIEWTCHLCNSTGNHAGSKWVQCDRCLAWLHYACVGISRKPRGKFFCCKCTGN